MEELAVHQRTVTEVVAANLADLIALPDVQAAEALNQYMIGLEWIDRKHALAPAERLVICRTMEERQLWKYLIDPDTGVRFTSLTSWLSSGFLGCRRVAMEAHTLSEELADVPAMNLLGVTKENLYVLRKLSTGVRNNEAVLNSAKLLPRKEFLENIEKYHPMQHVESTEDFRFTFGRSAAKDVQDWIDYAIEHDKAGTREEAIHQACLIARHDAELDEELEAMQDERSHDEIDRRMEA